VAETAPSGPSHLAENSYRSGGADPCESSCRGGVRDSATMIPLGVAAPTFDANTLLYAGLVFLLIGVVGGNAKIEVPPWKVGTGELRQVWQYVATFIIGLGCLIGGAAWKVSDRPEKFEVTGRPKIVVYPPYWPGPDCPVQVHFRATIRTSKAGTVKYSWFTKAGEPSDVRSVSISDDGSEVVTTDLTLGVDDPDTVDNPVDYSGQVFLEIHKPTEIRTAPGVWRVTCGD
jgi:hypothetical protein